MARFEGDTCCPFCGADQEDTSFIRVGLRYRVLCCACGAMGPRAERKTEAREKWKGEAPIEEAQF